MYGLYDNIKKGKQGAFKGLDLGLSRLSKFTYGIQKATYYTVFGAEGSGKSAFCINSFICSPYLDSLTRNDVNVKIRYYSLEVTKARVAAKVISWFVYKQTGALVSPATIFSQGDRMIPEFIENKINDMQEFTEELTKYIDVIDYPMTPSEIKNDLMKFAKSRGTVTKDEDGSPIYVPDDPNEHVIVIFDTLSNLKLESNGSNTSRKGTVDLHSEYCRFLYRNTFKYSVVNVMHSNRDMSSTNRVRYGEIAPKKEDIIDSSRPSQESNVVIAIFNPFDYMNANNNLAKHMGYDIPRLNDRFRSIYLLKNRGGSNNKRVACLFLGECGFFEELKKASDIKDSDYKHIASLTETYDIKPESQEA